MVANSEMQRKPRYAVSKFTVIAYALFFGPAVVIPAFVHQQMPMRGWVYFAWLFCTPLAVFIGNWGKGYPAKFFVGLTAAIIPIELVWYLAYASCFHTPDRKTIAIDYIPLITMVSLVLLPLGAILTYQATRKR